MRFPRFRLRTLMIVVAIVAVVAAPVTWQLREIERRREQAELLRQATAILSHRLSLAGSLRARPRVTVGPPARAPEATSTSKPE